MEQNQPQDIPKDAILNNAKLKLTLPRQDGMGSAPTLAVGVYQGNPSITVYTGQVENGRNQSVRAPLDLFGMTFVLESLRDLVSAPKANKIVIECSTHVKDSSGQRAKDPSLVAKIILTRKEDGFMTIAVISPDDRIAKMEFPFAIPSIRYINASIRNDPNAAITINHLCVKSWISVFERLVSQISLATYKPPEKPAGGFQRGNLSGNRQNGYGGGQRGGYQNNNRSGQYGNQQNQGNQYKRSQEQPETKKQDDFDADIPF